MEEIFDRLVKVICSEESRLRAIAGQSPRLTRLAMAQTGFLARSWWSTICPEVSIW